MLETIKAAVTLSEELQITPVNLSSRSEKELSYRH